MKYASQESFKLQEEITDASRPIDSFTDEELKLAFCETGDCVSIDEIRTYILPIMYDGKLIHVDCEYCGYGDGFSHRCLCGNRRLYWCRNDFDVSLEVY